MNTTSSQPYRQRPRDIRLPALVLLVGLVLVIAFFVAELPKSGKTLSQGELPSQSHNFESLTASPQPFGVEQEENVWRAEETWIDPVSDPQGHQSQARDMEADNRFQQGITMLHAQRFEDAIVAFGRTLNLVPNNPDLYVNMGYALLGLEDYQTAFHSFEKAMDINPAQANAYYGAAIAMEGMNDLEGALGGMRSFLHLSQDKPATQIHVARARSAIWEWESKLGRGPWGPTKGIPPGFTEEELKRNDMGVGIKVTVPGTEDNQGNMQYEIKYSDKFELFDK